MSDKDGVADDPDKIKSADKQLKKINGQSKTKGKRRSIGLRRIETLAGLVKVTRETVSYNTSNRLRLFVAGTCFLAAKTKADLSSSAGAAVKPSPGESYDSEKMERLVTAIRNDIGTDKDFEAKLRAFLKLVEASPLATVFSSAAQAASVSGGGASAQGSQKPSQQGPVPHPEEKLTLLNKRLQQLVKKQRAIYKQMGAVDSEYQALDFELDHLTFLSYKKLQGLANFLQENKFRHEAARAFDDLKSKFEEFGKADDDFANHILADVARVIVRASFDVACKGSQNMLERIEKEEQKASEKEEKGQRDCYLSETQMFDVLQKVFVDALLAFVSTHSTLGPKQHFNPDVFFLEMDRIIKAKLEEQNKASKLDLSTATGLTQFATRLKWWFHEQDESSDRFVSIRSSRTRELTQKVPNFAPIFDLEEAEL